MIGAERPRAFQSILKDKGIAEPSQAIPESVGRHLRGVPGPEDLIEIPDWEEFPLEEPAPIPKVPRDDAKLQFVQYQMQVIAANPATSSSGAQVDIDCIGPIFEIPTEFETVEDFVQFKRELATVYKLRSEKYKWPVPMGVCRFPTCLNSVAPTFEYCIAHLPMDAHFKDQRFFGQCRVMVGDHQCTIPCGIGGSKCAFHRALGRDASK